MKDFLKWLWAGIARAYWNGGNITATQWFLWIGTGMALGYLANKIF